MGAWRWRRAERCTRAAVLRWRGARRSESIIAWWRRRIINTERRVQVVNGRWLPVAKTETTCDFLLHRTCQRAPAALARCFCPAAGLHEVLFCLFWLRCHRPASRRRARRTVCLGRKRHPGGGWRRREDMLSHGRRPRDIWVVPCQSARRRACDRLAPLRGRQRAGVAIFGGR